MFRSFEPQQDLNLSRELHKYDFFFLPVFGEEYNTIFKNRKPYYTVSDGQLEAIIFATI